MKPTTNIVGSLRVWWIPQVPGSQFYVHVANIHEAKLILDTLARYDAFQFENNIKPDYFNIGGLQVLEEDGWCDWEDDDGNSIDDIEDETVKEVKS